MKSHVVLVNPAFMLKDGTVIGTIAQRDFPLGLGLLATILIDNGYTAEIINANAHSDWRRRTLAALAREDIAFVGFSCMSSQAYSAIGLAKAIKAQFPSVPVVFGGVHPTLMPESIARSPSIDYCVVGEGDAVVLPFMNYLNDKIPLDQVPNICRSNEDGSVTTTSRAALSTFDSLPDHLDETLYSHDIERYVLDRTIDGEELRGFSILTGLGCNYRCSFCINSITKRKYRCMPAHSIVKQMKWLKERYGIRFFNFQEEHFFGDKARLYALLELIEKDPDLFGQIAWNATIRVSDIRDGFVDVELLKRLKAAGGNDFGVGGESGSDRMLKALHKGILRKDIIRAVKFCNEAQVTLSFSFVMLWPGETFEDRVETARLIHEMYEMGPYARVPFFQTYRPYPGSLWESDLSRFEDPESIPDDTWRFQAIEKIKDLPIKNASMTYRLVNSTQVLCICGATRHVKRGALMLRSHLAHAIYEVCSWRIRSSNFRFYFEEPLLSFIRSRFAQY